MAEAALHRVEAAARTAEAAPRKAAAELQEAEEYRAPMHHREDQVAASVRRVRSEAGCSRWTFR
jgi:hypothetical protein